MSNDRLTSTSAEGRYLQERYTKDEKLSAFREEDGSGRKMAKAERQKLVRQQFPSVDNLNWENAFHNDLDLFARIMRDIIKLDQREPGKSGPRPNNMDYEKGLASFKQLIGEDFATAPFPEAFAFIAREYSLTQIARKVCLSRSRTHRLMQGKEEPSQSDMRLIAAAFNKHPSYFVEYRRTFIIEQLANKLLDAPEITISYYNKIAKAE